MSDQQPGNADQEGAPEVIDAQTKSSKEKIDKALETLSGAHALDHLSAESKQQLVSTIVQSADAADQQEVAAHAMDGLSADSKQQLVNTIVQSADPEEQNQVAAGAIGGLSADSKQQLVSTIVQSAAPANQKDVATGAIEALPQSVQQDVATSILGMPDPKTQQKLWYMVIGTIGGAIFIFGILTFVLVLKGKSAEGVLALATTALGGIVGLVSTSPVGSKRSN